MYNTKKFNNCSKSLSSRGTITEEDKFLGRFNFETDSMRRNSNLVCSYFEVDEFLEAIRKPDEDWKTVSDIILDFRVKKLKSRGEEFNGEYIKELLHKEDYIEVYIYLKEFFIESFDFLLTKKFLKKVNIDSNFDRIAQIMNTYKLEGYINCIMYI